MMTIFENVKSRDLLDLFTSISYDDVSDLCQRKTFERGEEYAESGQVSDMMLTGDKRQLQARVWGNENYSVRLVLKIDDIDASCTCPYDDGVCKHIVAVLLQCIDDPESIEVNSKETSGPDIISYLESLSKKELIEILMEYAGDEVEAFVKNNTAGKSEAVKKVNKIKRSIELFLQDDELLYNPAEMEDALAAAIRKLSGLESKCPGQVQDLIFYIIKSIDKAIDEGYLYDDYRAVDYSFNCPEDFIVFVTKYVKGLNFNDKVEFLGKLDYILKESSYDTFFQLMNIASEVFSDDELPALTSLLAKSGKGMSPELKKQYYKATKGILANKDRENLLIELSAFSETYTLELAEYYKKSDQPEKAIKYLKKWISGSKGYADLREIYVFYLDLTVITSGNLKKVAQEAIQHCPTRKMLVKVSSMLPDEMEVFEHMVETENPTELLEYYENEKRLAEGLALIKRKKNISEVSVYNFYKKNKSVFPTETKKYMSSIIARHLKYTGDSHYRDIADALKIISNIDSSGASRIAYDIRTTYGRRRNLIKMITEF